MKGDFKMELDRYEINRNTLLIVPIEHRRSKVYEYGREFIVNRSSLNIIKDSCLAYGSSYIGRKESCNYLLGIDMKTPIVIDEGSSIIFFPTSSCIRDSSIWVSYQNLIKYFKYDNNVTTLYFYRHFNINVDCKYNGIDRQFIRCIKLENLIMKKNFFLHEESNDYYDIFHDLC